MALLIIGLAVSLNLIIILIKFNRRRFLDGVLDASLLVIVAIVFGGSFNALVVGTVASTVVSVYLWCSPPTFGGTHA